IERVRAGSERRAQIIVLKLPLDERLQVLLRQLHLVFEQRFSPLADDEEFVGSAFLQKIDCINRAGRTRHADDDPHFAIAPVTIIAKTTNPRPALILKNASSTFAAFRCSTNNTNPVRSKTGATY